MGYKALIAYFIPPFLLIIFFGIGFLYASFLNLLFLIILSEIAITAWLMIRIAYDEKNRCQISNTIEIEQTHNILVVNEEFACN